MSLGGLTNLDYGRPAYQVIVFVKVGCDRRGIGPTRVGALHELGEIGSAVQVRIAVGVGNLKVVFPVVGDTAQVGINAIGYCEHDLISQTESITALNVHHGIAVEVLSKDLYCYAVEQAKCRRWRPLDQVIVGITSDGAFRGDVKTIDQNLDG